MFFNLEYIDQHPCTRMHEVIVAFFQRSIQDSSYSDLLFPKWYRDTIKISPTLNKGFKKIHKYLHEQDENFRDQIYHQILNNNYISELCSNRDFPILSHMDWGSKKGKKFKEFFMDNLYGALDAAVFKPEGCIENPKKDFYKEFIKKNKIVCPFCGMDRYINPKWKSHSDFDHYLNKADYPFTAANFQNLVPMCDPCNQDYKKKKSVISNGQKRTLAFYPYEKLPEMCLIVECEHEAANLDEKTQFNVFLYSSDPEVIGKIETWDRVFEIRDRIKKQIEFSYDDCWMEDFFDNDFIENGPVEHLDEFRELLNKYSEKQIPKIKRRNKIDVIIIHEFFRFMANGASNAFLIGYLKSFNKRLQILAA